MRIVYIVEGVYPDSGGTPRVVAALHDEMKTRGHEVLVVCPEGSSGIDILPVRAFRVPPATEGAIWLSGKQKHLIEDFKPDIIHSHNDRLAIFFGKRLSAQLGIPHVHTLHADYATLRPHYQSAKILSRVMSQHAAQLAGDETPRSQLDWDVRDMRTLHDLARSVDQAFTPAKYIYNALHATTPQLHYLPSGHDFQIRSARDLAVRSELEPLRLVTVSRVVIEKRIDTLIEAIALAKEQVSVELTVIGSGKHQARFERLAQRLGVADAIHFAGTISDRQALMHAYDEHDAFILGSYHYETQGLVLLEAAARGLPIIYCDERLVVGVNQQNAILTPPDPASLAQGIITFSDTASRQRRRMAEASLAEAERWRFAATADAYETAYLSLLSAVSA